MKTKTILSIVLFLTCGIINIQAQVFEVSFSNKTMSEPFSGDVLVYLSKYNKTPKDVFVGADLSPVFRVSVKNVKPSEKIIFDDKAISYPVVLSDLERGNYYMQAVFDRNLGGKTMGNSPGNIYSTTKKIKIDKNFEKRISVLCDQVVPELKFVGDDFAREIKFTSELLSKFHEKPIFFTAAIVLPDDYYESKQSYPVLYKIMGFGGNYCLPSGTRNVTTIGNKKAIVVHLDGNCPEGHSVYTNSDINGPWGDAFVQELIPFVNKNYRTDGASLVTGHSSGGWASLSLQINYPKAFVGCWASAPDYVDFRQMHAHNIYKPVNLFIDEEGHYIADLTLAGKMPLFKTMDVLRMEHVICRGEQYHSFDAVFSKYDENNKIVRLIDVKTGDVNQKAVPYWKRYDISLKLRNNWDFYKDKIGRKILITVGNQDNFYLNRPIRLMEEEMQKINAEVYFRYFSGDHFTVHSNEAYQKAGMKHLSNCYQNWLKNKK